MRTASRGERMTTVLTAPPGCHPHGGSGVFVTFRHSQQTRAITGNWQSTLFLLTSRLNHTTRISSHHLALINGCGSAGPGSAKKQLQWTHCMASYLITSLPFLCSYFTFPSSLLSNFLLYITAFIYPAGVDPVLIDERTY